MVLFPLSAVVLGDLHDLSEDLEVSDGDSVSTEELSPIGELRFQVGVVLVAHLVHFLHLLLCENCISVKEHMR